MLWIFKPSPARNTVLSFVRLVVGLLFMTSGTMKVFGYPPSPQPMPPFDPMSQIGIAGLLEVFGGALIAVGLLTRPVAFVLSGEMAAAYFIAHAPQSFFPAVNDGLPAVLYCFIFFYMAFAGGGPWSVDALIARWIGQSDPAWAAASGDASRARRVA